MALNGDFTMALDISRLRSAITLGPGTNPVVHFGTLLTGDVNDSNAVTLSDYAALRLTFGKCSADDGYDPRPDLNGSGCVTLQDYALLRTNFGMAGPLPTGP